MTMTECERIIKDGIVPKDYYKSEVIDDFLVTSDRKKLFAVLLDILVKIDTVCKKHNIRYYIYGGTLIGALRHKGFIPWDDDLDIVMFREDYEKLVSVSYEFTDPYFFQTPYTDKGFFWTNPTIRNKNTTAVTPCFAYQPCNHGAFVDIFTLENTLNNQEGRYMFELVNNLTIDNSTYMRMSNPFLDRKNKARVEEYKKRERDPFVVYEEIQKEMQKFNGVQTPYVTTPMATFYGFDKKLYYREDFMDTTLLEFEGRMFPAPIGYERVLKTTYKNYMELPPIEKRGIHHNIIFNMDIPYNEYIAKNISIIKNKKGE